MSLLKNWKLLLAALAIAMFTACAGSSGGSAGGSSDVGGEASEGSAAAAQKPKEEISEAKLKKAESEAMSSTEENHKLRKEIFEAKTKLGMSADEEVPVE